MEANEQRGAGGPAAEFVTLQEVLEFVSRWKVTIGLTVLAITGVAAVRTARRPPTFQAAATLLLEQGRESGGLLSDLATLTSAPAAENEMAILRSRSLAEDVVRDPQEWTLRSRVFEPTPPDDFHAERPVHLGLTARVWSEDLSPFQVLLDVLRGVERSPHRLFATFDESAPESEGELTVSFPASDRVRISRPGTLGLGEGHALELPYEAGAEIAYERTRLRLTATGDYVGKSYRVARVPFRVAVDDLMGRVSVRETARNSGVLRLSVEDTDPNRAAEVANAVARTYIARSVQIGGLRATKTMAFLEVELERVTKLLREAEQEVVELYAQNTQGIDGETSSRVMIEQLAAYEKEKIALHLSRIALQDAKDLIDAGAYEALARLSHDLPDIVTLGYVEAIGKLSADALQLERSDAGAYKFLLQEKVAELQSTLEQAGLRARSLRGVLAAIESGDRDALARLAGIPGGGGIDGASRGYVTAIVGLDTELAELAQVVTEEHPEYAAKAAARVALLEHAAAHVASELEGVEMGAADQAEVAEDWQRRIDDWPAAERGRITSAIDELKARISRNIASRIEGIDSRLVSLDETTCALEANLVSLPESQRILAEPTRRSETYAEIARLLMESLQEAQLTRAATMPSAVLVDPAVPPARLLGPSIFTNLLLTALLSFLIGMGLAWLRSSLTDSVHTLAEVEQITNLPSIGTVPDFRRGPFRRQAVKAGFIHMRDDPSGACAEAFRSVRENLRFALEPGQELRTFAATSSTPDEGKTITNINLALGFASSESRVLLVDADLRKPSVAGYFDLAPGPGLREVLRGTDWHEAVRPSGYPGLDVLPTGRVSRSVSDLLRGAHVRRFVQDVAAAYDLVVFDLPPVMAVADVETFANQLDGVVLVVRAEAVPRRIVATTSARLRRAGIKMVGTVLNAVRPQRYGYHYYYYKGYGSTEGETPRQRSAG